MAMFVIIRLGICHLIPLIPKMKWWIWVSGPQFRAVGGAGGDQSLEGHRSLDLLRHLEAEAAWVVDKMLMEDMELVQFFRIAWDGGATQGYHAERWLWRCFSRKLCLWKKNQEWPGDVHPNSCPFALTKQCRRASLASIVAFAAVFNHQVVRQESAVDAWYRGLPRLEMESDRVALPHFFFCFERRWRRWRYWSYGAYVINSGWKVMPLLSSHLDQVGGVM